MSEQLSSTEVAQLRKEISALGAELGKFERLSQTTFDNLSYSMSELVVGIERLESGLDSVASKLDGVGAAIVSALSVSAAEAKGLGDSIRKVGGIASGIVSLIPGGQGWATGLNAASQAAGLFVDAIGMVKAALETPTFEAQTAAINEYQNALLAASSGASKLSNHFVQASRAQLEEQESSLKRTIFLTKVARSYLVQSPELFEQATSEIEAYEQQLERVQLALAGVLPPVMDLNNIHVDLAPNIAYVSAVLANYTKEQNELARSTVDLASIEQLRGETVVDVNERLKQSLNELARVEIEKRERQQQAAGEYISTLEREIEVLSLRAAGQKDAADKLQLEQQLIEKLGAAYGINENQIIELITKKAELTAETERQKKAEEEAAAAAKKAADEIKGIWDKAGDDLFSVWKDGWRATLSGNLKDFDDFAKRIGQIGLNLVADLMAVQSRDWLKGVLFGDGNGVAAASGNPTGILSSLVGGSINDVGVRLGFSNPAFAPYGGTSGAWTSAGLGQVLGAGAIGYIGGNLFGSAVGMRNPGNAGLGAGAGAMIGMTVGGPWGALIGGGIGSLAGLIGPRPSDRTEGLTFNWESGEEKWGFLEGKRSPENEALAKQLFASVSALREALLSAGLNPHAQGGLIEVGSGNSLAPFRVALGSGDIHSFETADQAMAFLANRLVDSLDDVPTRLQEIVNNFDGSNIEEFLAELQKVADFDKGMEGIRNEIQRLTDPQQWELAQLQAEFAPLLEQAQSFGTPEDEAAIRQLMGLRTSSINEQYDDGFDGMLDGIRDELAQATDPQQFELDELKARYDEMKALAEKHQEGIAEVEDWYGRHRQEIVNKYANEAARKEEERLAQEAARIQDVLAQVMQQAQGNISQQLDVLAQQRQMIEESIGQYRSILDSLKSAKARFASDPRISPTSNEQRLADLMRQLNDAAAKARNGDKEAAAEVADLAMAAAEANVAFNASSEEGARVQKQIAGILDSTSNLIDSELRLAERDLQANEDQVTLLQQILDSINAPAERSPTTAADLNALVAAFGQANARYNFSGMTPQQIETNPIWKQFETTLFDYIARLEKSDTSINWLKTSLAWAPNDLGTNFEAAARRRVERLMERLRDFGITPVRPPGFARGGRTGHLALVHPNEMIYTGPPAMVYNARETASMMSGGNVLRELQGIRADIGVLSRTVSITGEDQVVQLARQDMRLAAIESNFSLARARA